MIDSGESARDSFLVAVASTERCQTDQRPTTAAAAPTDQRTAAVAGATADVTVAEAVIGK